MSISYYTKNVNAKILNIYKPFTAVIAYKTIFLWMIILFYITDTVHKKLYKEAIK